jgi:rare lipoprotein A
MSLRRFGASMAVLSLVAGCVPPEGPRSSSRQSPIATPSFFVGAPYELEGVWYYPAEDYNYDRTGLAAWVGDGAEPRLTANGELFDARLLTAAHRTLPLPSLVRVTNLDNGLQLVVRVNDRGPAAPGRSIALTRRAAELLEFAEAGTAKVRIEMLADESRAIAEPLRAVPSTSAVAGTGNDGSPAPRAAPRANVAVEALDIGAGQGAGQGPRAMLPRPAAGRAGVDVSATVPGAVAADGRFLPTETVARVPVGPRRQIWVQAGPLTVRQAADRIRARLASFGPTRIESRMVGRTQEFHVRLGPLRTPDAADQAFQQVLGAGVNGAQVVVD